VSALACLIVALSGRANAGIIDYPGTILSSPSNTVAANDPANGNVWTGQAQSFTAQDPNVLFGFYVANATPTLVSEPLLFSLYSGDGEFSNLLKQASATASLGSFTSELLQVDFSSISLTPGNQYTVVLSLPSQGLPPSGTYADISGLYNSLNNSYAGGQFYYVGSSYNAGFGERDMAFNVTPVGVTPVSTPEPGALGLMLAGLGSLILASGTRRHRTN
jgi:hypothetical protein